MDLKPGQLLLYESAKCTHGRPRTFRGHWYTSLFIHYRPVSVLAKSKLASCSLFIQVRECSPSQLRCGLLLHSSLSLLFMTHFFRMFFASLPLSPSLFLSSLLFSSTSILGAPFFLFCACVFSSQVDYALKPASERVASVPESWRTTLPPLPHGHPSKLPDLTGDDGNDDDPWRLCF